MNKVLLAKGSRSKHREATSQSRFKLHTGLSVVGRAIRTLKPGPFSRCHRFELLPLSLLSGPVPLLNLTSPCHAKYCRVKFCPSLILLERADIVNTFLMTVAYVVLHTANSSTVDSQGSKQARVTGPQLALCTRTCDTMSAYAAWT